MRGHAPEVPKGYDPEGVAVAAAAEHPYLRNMQYRGGGYAILRALYEAEQKPRYLGSLSILQICYRGQKHCDDEMNPNHWGGRDNGHGWESNKSLLRYNQIQRDQHGRGYATGWRGPVDSVRLTAEGRAFIPEMLKKFNRAVEPDAEAEITSFSHARALPDKVRISGLPRPVRPKSTRSINDEEELEVWLHSASIGDKRIIKVSKDRRLYLHRVADMINMKARAHWITTPAQFPSSRGWEV